MNLTSITRTLSSRAGVVRVRNVLNPLLWLCAIVTAPMAVIAYAFRDDPFIRYGALGLAALPIVLTCVAYVFWALRDPDRLQSEEFQLRQQELTIESKGGNPLVAGPFLSDDTASTDVPPPSRSDP